MTELYPPRYKALLFDVYCTLVDWETGLYDGLKPMLERVDSPFKDNMREALAAYFSVETNLQAKYPTMLYADLIARAHTELAIKLRGEPSHSGAVPSTTDPGSVDTSAPATPNEAEHIAFGKSIPSWPVFPDTIQALTYLSTKYKLAVLSNVDHESFAGTRAVLETSDPKHQFKFDAVYTAQDIGSYKPDLANFKYALAKLKEEFGIEKDEVIMVAGSLIHDHIPANTLGMASVFIDRKAVTLNHGSDAKQAKYNEKYGSLGEFAKSVERAVTK